MGIGDGSTGLTDVSYGGRPIQNSVVSSSGYYNVNQAGSYYEKTHAIYNIVAQGWGRAIGRAPKASTAAGSARTSATFTPTGCVACSGRWSPMIRRCTARA